MAGRVRQCAADPQHAPRRPDRAGADRAGRAERPYAYVIKDDNTVERRAVEVAAVQDGVAVIAKGLTPGEKVVVDGQYRLTNGVAGAARRAATPGAGADDAAG